MAPFARRGYAILMTMLTMLMPVRLYAQAQFDFDLPAQPLAQSLRAVGGRTHITIAFDPGTVGARQAPALKGNYTPHEALERLLHSSGLRIRMTSGGSYWVEIIPTNGTPPREAEHPSHTP